jgi:hypothetical protein
MKQITPFLLVAGLAGWAMAAAADDFSNPSNPYAYAPPLSDNVRLSPKVIECVYVMPQQITKLIFPKPIDEVSVNSMMVSISRNQPDSKENYLLLSPKVAQGDIDMHVVMDGQTYTFRLLIGNKMVNYRKTYTVKGASAASHSVMHVPPLAPSEINTVNLVKMITQAAHEPNYAESISQDMGVSAQGRQYLWNGMEVTLLEAWHYYKQDVVILHLQVHNPTSKAQYLSATQIEPYVANTKFEPLLTQQATKVLLPGQSDDKYLFLQGYALDIDDIHFELRLPATGTQLKPE